MNKKERIARYGKAAYTKLLLRNHKWREAHPEVVKERSRKWYEDHSKAAKARISEWQKTHQDRVEAVRVEHRKGGKFYQRKLIYQKTGLQRERNRVRKNHWRKWRHYKDIIAPDSQIHHEWIPGTADYRGVALVEKDQHMHGVVDVIEILEGKTTLLTEEEIRREVSG